MGGEGALIVYDNVNFRKKVVTTKQLVSRRMWDLVIILAGYGSNNIRLRVYENVDWTVFHSDDNFFLQKVLFAIKQF